MVEKISVKMVPHTFEVVKNIDKPLVSTDSHPENFGRDPICVGLGGLSPYREYRCNGSMYFNEKKVSNQSLSICTDYAGKCNAYFCFRFHIFLGTPTMKPIIWVSWG